MIIRLVDASFRSARCPRPDTGVLITTGVPYQIRSEFTQKCIDLAQPINDSSPD